MSVLSLSLYSYILIVFSISFFVVYMLLLLLTAHDRKVSFELLSAPSLHHHDY
nr:MAG TPA: hypothetical protein [Herelleviridae sp.]